MPAMTAAVMLAAPREFAGIASGVLSAARQVGGVLGVALLGTFIADKVHFSTGMHAGLAIVAAAFLAGAVLASFTAGRPRQEPGAGDAARQAAAPATASSTASNG